MSTIFSDIIAGKIPCDKVYESDHVLAFKDINPVAPVHLLIIPKKQIPDLQAVTSDDASVIMEMLNVVQKLAKEFKIEGGYRLITNNGRDAGQTVFHLHFHLLGGRCLGRLG